MTDTTRSPEELAAVEASKPGTFSLIERLQGRNLPSDTETVYLAEDAAYEYLKLQDEHASYPAGDEAGLAALEAKMAEVHQSILDSAAVFYMTGVSTERYDELVEETDVAFPLEFEVVKNPLTGRITREPKANLEREVYFNRLYLSEVITRVEMGGEVDDNITPDWVEACEKFLPRDGLRRIVKKAFDLRMIVEWMDAIQNEDFSQKP